MLSRLAVLCLCLAAVLSSCATAPVRLHLRTNRPLVLATDPPGARVRIDGRDSGWVTPCVLRLEQGESYRIEFSYPGYRTASRALVPESDTWTLLWAEMYTHEGTWRFPLWLGIEDFLIPIKYERGQSPSRVFVRMKRSADSE